MSGVATAIAGSAIIGAVVANNASNRAASAQRDATNSANALQQSQFDQNRADLAPWREAGIGALGQLSDLTRQGGEFSRSFQLSDFQQDPGYQFRMDEGRKNLERGASARGGLFNGGTLKALARYGQDYASNEFQNAYGRFNNDRTTRYNQLASLAGLGQTATSQTAQLGSNAAAQMGMNYMNQGAGQSAAYLANGNAMTGAINTAGNTWANYLAQRNGQSGGYLNTNPLGGQLYGSGNGGTEYIP